MADYLQTAENRYMRRFRYLIYCISIMTLIISISYGTSGCAQEDTAGGDLPETVPAEALTQEASEDAVQNESERDDREMIVVYVCGSVLRPDVYKLPDGSRIYEAIEKAGGCSPQADPSRLNLAQAVTDGQRIYVPPEAESGGSAQEGQTDASQDGGGSTVNINTAAKAELMMLPGIGEARAESIITYRNAHGFFSSAEGIREVEGIGEALFERIKDRITV